MHALVRFGVRLARPDCPEIERCEEENIIFVGPSPDAIYKMGNKTIAKQLARNTGSRFLKEVRVTWKIRKKLLKLPKK